MNRNLAKSGTTSEIERWVLRDGLERGFFVSVLRVWSEGWLCHSLRSVVLA